MISEKSFAHSYSSFWQGVLPLGDSLIRRLNRTYVNMAYKPIESTVDANRRGFVNELGFELFRMLIQGSRADLPGERLRAAQNVRQRISSLQLRHTSEPTDSDLPSTNEWKEADTLQRRLRHFFAGHSLMIDPFFSGCGILDSCNGDVLVDDTLFEVKAGDRPFRISDVRQVLVYCALNFESKQYEISRVGLFNPRIGTYVSGSLEQFSHELCGMSASDLCGTIISFLSASGVSG